MFLSPPSYPNQIWIQAGEACSLPCTSEKDVISCTREPPCASLERIRTDIFGHWWKRFTIQKSPPLLLSRISPVQFGPQLWKPPLTGWLELQKVIKVAGDRGRIRFGNTEQHHESPTLLLRAADASLQTAMIPSKAFPPSQSFPSPPVCPTQEHTALEMVQV